MDISFNSKLLRDLCEDDKLAEKTYGIRVADVLFDRLADIESAVSVHDLIAGQPTSLKIGKKEFLRIGLIDDFYIYFEANPIDIPFNEKSRVDWPIVRRLKVHKIEKHDK